MNQTTPTLLYIDDDGALARLVDRGLTRRGYKVVHAASGEEGLEHIRRAQTDGGIDVVALDQYMPGLDHKGSALLILLDLNLPDTSGIDILKRVKENNFLKTTPVVVLTTTDDSHEIKRCYELGCNVYITKPVNYESFANAIRQLGLFFSVIQVPPAAT